MLARTAAQPHVLVGLIQCATMATEIVEVTIESEEDVINNNFAWQSSMKKERKARISEELYVLTIVFSSERELFTRQKGPNSRRNIYSAFHN